MRIEYLSKFNKDLDGIKPPFVKKSILKVILQVEAAKSLADIPHCKKLSGYKSGYRIRADYGIGIFVEEDRCSLPEWLIEKIFIKSFLKISVV